jgi:predicted 3-demethylubiquinone-9 3-methyltransferase (glyoxalase superfamily)
MTSEPLTTCLWFDDQAEEAARFYTGVFKDAALGDLHRYTEAGPGKAGTVMLAEFTLNGQKFTALNGGPQSFGSEVDYYWDALISGGGEPSVCGWLKDRYGVSWQIVPAVFHTMVRDQDETRKARVTKAMLSMTKFDIAALQAAYAGASE